MGKRLIDATPIIDECVECMNIEWNKSVYTTWAEAEEDFKDRLLDAPIVKAYTPHEVAEIIAELFGDTCACNFNGIDEWLPEHCELLDACPNTCGVACWEQYLKFRDGERKDNA